MPKAPEEKNHAKKSMRVIRNVYLYLVAMIGLITLIFGSVGIIDNVVKNFVFQVDDTYYVDPFPVGMKGGVCAQSYIDPTDKEGKRMLVPTEAEVKQCEEQLEKNREQSRRNEMGRQFSISIAQILVGLPIWLFHWGIIQREYRRKREEE